MKHTIQIRNIQYFEWELTDEYIISLSWAPDSCLISTLLPTACADLYVPSLSGVNLILIIR